MSIPELEPSHQPAPKRRWLRYVGLALIALVLLVPLLGVAALKGWLPEPVVTAAARLLVGRQAGALPWDGKQPVNLLIMGIQIGGASTNPLTDTLLVASYQPGGKVSLLSIPRDLWVEIPGHGHARINEAFQSGGPRLAMLTVQQNLGIPVNYYALISYEAFQRLIDDVGGVTVQVEQEIDDPTFPAPDQIHYEPFHIAKGTHHLDGREALRYARTRHADSDFGRAARQQQVLMALQEQLLKPANWIKLPTILRSVRSTVVTNFPLDQSAALGLRALQAGQIDRQVLQYENKAVYGHTTPAGASVLLANPEVVGGIVEGLYQPSLALLQGAGEIRVENGNGYSGAAGQFSRLLGSMGAKVLEPGDADRNDYPASSVALSSRSPAVRQAARFIATMLGAELVEGTGEPGIVVTLGRDYAPYVDFGEAEWREALTPR